LIHSLSTGRKETAMFAKKLTQILDRSFIPEKRIPALRALKQENLLWKELVSSDLLDRLVADWPGENFVLTPARVALFELDPALLQSVDQPATPSVDLLEQAMLAYEEYLHAQQPVQQFRAAALLALALDQKERKNVDWTALFKEALAQQGIDSIESWQEYWQSVYSLLFAWSEDRSSFLQALLQARTAEFGLPLVQSILFSQPFESEEIGRYYKNLLNFQPLSLQLEALHGLEELGDEALPRQLAAELLERHAKPQTDEISVAQVWASSAKSMEQAITQRQLAALAQYAGETELADHYLSAAEKLFAAEYAGVQVQKASLHSAEILPVELEIPAVVKEDPQVMTELAMTGGEPTVDLIASESPLASLLGAEKIMKAGNETLARQIARESSDALVQPAALKAQRAVGWNRRQLVDQYEALGLWGKAAQVLEELIRQSPADAALYRQLWQTAQQVHNPQQSIQALENLTLLEPENASWQKQLAEAYYQAEDWQQAFAGYEDYFLTHDDAQEADLLQYAEAAVKVGRADLALQTAEKVLNDDPENGRALAVMGFAHHKLGQSEKALDFLNRSVASAPESVDPWLLMAELHREKGQPEQAITVLNTAHTTFPRDQRVVLTLAKTLLAAGQASNALSLLQADGTPTDFETALTMIAAEKTLGVTGLEELVSKTYAAFPDRPQAIYEYADLALQKGERQKAAHLLEPVLADAGCTDEWRLAYVDSILGEDYRNVQKTGLPENESVQRARALLSEVLARDAHNLAAKTLAGELAIKEGESAKAFEFLSNLLKDSENENSSWFDRIQAGFARAAAFLGKFDLALGAIQNLTESHPDWVGVNQTLAEIDQTTGEISDAVTQANQVLDAAQNVAESAGWFADFMSNLGKREEAEKAIENLAKVHRDPLPLQLTLAEMKLADGELAAVQTLEAQIKHGLVKCQQEKLVTRAARLFDAVGDTAGAVDALRYRAGEKSTSSVAAKVDLAGYLRSHGQPAEAELILNELQQSLGSQKWLGLITAETQHAAGKTALAFELLKNLPETNQQVPQKVNLSFTPAVWGPMLDEDAQAGGLAQELAFESTDYAQVREVEEGKPSLLLEADYALGDGSEIGSWLEDTSAESKALAEPMLAAQLSEILLDAGQTQRAGEFLMTALEKYSESAALKLNASRQAALSGDWATAEALFVQELPHVVAAPGFTSAQAVSEARQAIKAAFAAAHWQEAEAVSRRLAADQPKNACASSLRLQTLTKALEFFYKFGDLGAQQHGMGEIAVDSYRSELLALTENSAAGSSIENEHWLARAKAVLDPNQTNIRRLAMISPSREDIEAMMLALIRSGQEQTAIQLGKKHLDESGTAALLARASLERDLNAAAAAIEQAEKDRQALPVIHVLGAKISQMQKETYAAINRMEEALESWPEESNWHASTAELWNQVGDWQNSAKHYEAVLAAHADDSVAALQLGKVYLQSKNFEPAIERLQQVTEQELNQFEAWEGLADAYYQSGKIDAALFAAEHASQINEFSASPYLLRAQILMGKGDAKSALELAQKVLRQEETQPEALLLAAKAFALLGNKPLALQTLEKASHSSKATLSLFIEQAKLVKEINGAANARSLLESLAERYPDNVELLNMLADSQFAAGDRAGAEKSAQLSLQLANEQPQMQKFLGQLELESGNLDQAIHHFSQSIAQKSDDVEAYLELSKVYEQQRDFASALKTLEQAMTLDPENLSAVLAAAALMKNARDYAKAEALLRKAAELAPNDLNVRRQLGAVIALNLVESSQEASSHL
jgi:tetratricopeptide (TPR) repeat protein